MSSKPTVKTSMTFHEWSLLLALSILWGGSFFFNSVTVRELPTSTVVVSRVALASVAFLLAGRVTGQCSLGIQEFGSLSVGWEC